MNAKILIIAEESLVQSTIGELEGYDTGSIKVISDIETAVGEISQNYYPIVVFDLRGRAITSAAFLRVAELITTSTEVILITKQGSYLSVVQKLLQRAKNLVIRTVRSDEPSADFPSIKEKTVGYSSSPIGGLKESVSETLQPKTPLSGQILIGPDTVMDPHKRIIQSGNQRVLITPLEMKLLRIFLANPGRLVTHQEIVQQVHGYEVTEWEAPKLVRPIISRLRGKLSHFDGGENWIVSVRGSGYIYEGVAKTEDT